MLKPIWKAVKGWLYWVLDQIKILHIDRRLPKPTCRLECTIWRREEDSKETSCLFTRSFLYSFIISPRAVMIRHGTQGFVCAHTSLLKENEIFLGFLVPRPWCILTSNCRLWSDVKLFWDYMITLYSLKVSLIPESFSVMYKELSCFLKFIFMESMLSYGCMPGGFTNR